MSPLSPSFRLPLLAAVPASLLLLGTVQADRDNAYYRPGRGNPNIYFEKMYWEDASNILEDLSSFSSLYVEFHHCAWTQMQDNGEDGSVDENDYWYMGKVPPFGANVAYSLYGALAGEEFSGCNKNTFINSFYTNTGFESFSNAMYYAGVDGFYYSGDDDRSYGYSSACGGYYGVGCNYQYGFAVHTYSTSTCNPQYFKGVSDTMQGFNMAMNNAQCIQIYDKDNYAGYYYGTPLSLLANSNACFYQNFWAPDGQCPDPYGKIAEYQNNFNNGVKNSEKAELYTGYKEDLAAGERMRKMGVYSFVIGFAMILFGIFPRLAKKHYGMDVFPMVTGFITGVSLVAFGIMSQIKEKIKEKISEKVSRILQDPSVNDILINESVGSADVEDISMQASTENINTTTLEAPASGAEDKSVAAAPSGAEDISVPRSEAVAETSILDDLVVVDSPTPEAEAPAEETSPESATEAAPATTNEPATTGDIPVFTSDAVII